jgi:hypothetical protein
VERCEVKQSKDFYFIKLFYSSKPSNAVRSMVERSKAKFLILKEGRKVNGM